MIIVNLMGGLGNQMFQYALGRRLAMERAVPLKLDLSWFSQQKMRRYRLDQFQISAETATPAEICFFTKCHCPSVLWKMFEKLRTKHPQWLGQVVTYPGMSYYPQALQVPKYAYLNGYWQSEKYFKPIRQFLLQELIIKEGLVTPIRQMLDIIQSTNSVSLHIRRGDYVNNPRSNHVHGVLSLMYYQQAMQGLEGAIRSPHYFVFSDDIPWARQHLQDVKNVTFVDQNDPEQDHLDLTLMSACKHHIIANSSFSWWAAWLNQNQGKLVFAPRRWFNDFSFDTQDLIPDGWILV